MEHITEKIRRWLLPVVLSLFILQIVTFPYAAGYTFAAGSGAPGNVLTYHSHSLFWEKSLGVDPATGAVELGLFDTVTADGRHVIAPGSSGSGSVRLFNESAPSLSYTAVLYRIRNNDAIPVTPVLYAAGSSAAEHYTLPAGVGDGDVLAAVTGKLKRFETQDFSVFWNWASQSDAQDLQLSKENGQITVGLYIVVEDDFVSTTPKTGDDSHIGMYSALMVISGLLLILLLVDRRREEQEMLWETWEE